MSQKQKPHRRMSLGSLALIVCLICGAAIAGYVFLPKLLADTLQDRSNGDTENHIPAATIRSKANQLAEGFQRAVTLGLAPADLRYGTGGATDLVTGLNLLPTPRPVTGDSLPGGGSASWALGGGQLIGAYQPQAPDLAFFLAPLSLTLCRDINREIWGDSNGEPVATGVPLSDWHERKANILEVFGGKSRTEGCLTTVEGKHLYYRMVYGTTTRGDSDAR